jgi:hypothetical protein
VVASDAFDDFISAVLPVRDALPVVSAEIGDTWIQGASSDPLKVAQYRAVLRLRASCIAAGECDPTAPTFRTFDRLLMKLGEHTWGWNGGIVREQSWANDELQHSLKTNAQFYTSPWTWVEQRMFINNALDALPPSPFKRAVLAELAAIQPKHADQAGSGASPSRTGTHP